MLRRQKASYLSAYCRPIHLQTGICFIRLKGGHKQCLGFRRTPILWAVIGPSTQSVLYWLNATRLQLEMWYMKTLYISLYTNASKVFAWGHSLLWDKLGKLTGSLFMFHYAEEFLGIYIIILRIQDACGSNKLLRPIHTKCVINANCTWCNKNEFTLNTQRSVR